MKEDFITDDYEEAQWAVNQKGYILLSREWSGVQKKEIYHLRRSLINWIYFTLLN
jgi:hypothetical protein